MADTQTTMTEFTYAPGEKDIVGDCFSPSVVLFWLKSSVAASNMRIQYRGPNTLLGIIPLGAETQTIPLRNIASVDTSVKFWLGRLIIGAILFFAGLSLLANSPLVGIILLLLGIANLANTMTMTLNFVNQAGGKNSITVSILEKAKLNQLANAIQERVFADMEGIRHAEMMNVQQQQFAVQTQQAMLQQQMLQAQIAQAQAAPAATAPTTPVPQAGQGEAPTQVRSPQQN